ncbi:tail protein [Bacillus phage Ray17]|uniref:Tail protein n=1 Tax=Bacillus phage Ray17 TaxID=2315627 RepID=A0A386K754_9CAUD|nr:tail protein [Bacillus phage Ray17]AYD80953.1 tail protein [Bacillus phage Ray17]
MPELQEVANVEQIRQDILELKANDRNQEQRISQLERTTDKHDQQIMAVTEKLSKIDENTTWIKRTIMGAIVTTVTGTVITGVLAIVWNMIQN